jgi:hypothetical protein
MKDLTTNTREKPSQIFAQVVSQCDDNVQALLFREENPKRTIRYQRPIPPVSPTYADVRLPEQYTTTTNNSFNTTTARIQKNRMLVFYSPESLERLANAQTFFIFMDGTFSVPPHPFKQLYTIRVPFKDVTGTTVYAFLQMSRYLQGTPPVYCLNCHACNLHFNVQTLKMQFCAQLRLYLVATSITRAVSTT